MSASGRFGHQPKAAIRRLRPGGLWGAECKVWRLMDTATGYAGGETPTRPTKSAPGSLLARDRPHRNVLVVFDPKKISSGKLLKVFWGNHDPTQGSAGIMVKARSTAWRSIPIPTRRSARQKPRARPISACCLKRSKPRSPPKLCPPRNSTTPKTTISRISPTTAAAILLPRRRRPRGVVTDRSASTARRAKWFDARRRDPVQKRFFHPGPIRH
ncbi:MAG: hypothetical protein EOP83_30775 [Verrucomicrobiaceae bacterium]|nr:MAG: hypothetical protein EOP83_30775 [Verrucomicrobiaceae bacterium]